MSRVNKVNWSPKKLNELGFIGRGKSRHRPRNDPVLYGGSYPLVQTADIASSECYITKYSKTYNEIGLAQSKLWDRNTLCIIIAGENTAENAILTFKACFPDSIIGFIPYPNESDIHYIKYYLDTIKPQLRSITKGATQDNLSLEKLLSFDILTPPLSVQRKIATILSAYDDLIENNTRRIKILEEIAQALYREWFVQFKFPGHEEVIIDPTLGRIPNGWMVKKLFEVAETTYGCPFKSKLFTQEPIGTPVIRIRDIRDNKTETYTTEHVSEKYFVENGDIIVGMDGDFFVGKWAGGRAYLNQRVVRFRPLKNLSRYYLYLSILSPISILNSTITGTTVAHLSDKDLRAITLAIPDEEIRKITKEMFDPIFDLEIKLEIKNKTLRRTRDLLLPKLISGELNVEDLNIKIETSNS